MRYWIMKSEPSEFSIDDLQRVKRQFWDGIRNYQVRNMMRDVMQKGDLALFYHSSAAEIGVVGIMKIVTEAYPDPAQFDPKSKYVDLKSDPKNPRWLGVEVGFVKKFKKIVTLSELKQQKKLADMPLLRRGNRLSVVELTKSQFDHILKLANRN